MTSLIPIPNEYVRSYLEIQGNKAPGYPTDTNGRFLSPLDNVYVAYETDEGAEVLVEGTIVNVLASHSVVKMNERFAKSFGVEYATLSNSKIIRMPPFMSFIRGQVERFFVAMNTEIIVNSDLHIRGRSIR